MGNRARAFPGGRKGQIAHQLAMSISDSHWHKQISSISTDLESAQNVYWTWPFENYKTFCPYLVGSYQTVADELRRYMQIGYSTFILDIPPNREELQHVRTTFQRASEQTRP